MKRIALLIGALATALSVMTASAIPINVTVSSTGALLNGTGVANKTQYGQGNNNPTSNLNFLNAEISLWNGAFNPDLPTAIGPVALNVEGLNGSSYNAVAGYDYLVFHFGNGIQGPAKSPGGWWQAWYLNGDGGAFNVPSVGDQSVGGFSSARFYNPHINNNVPDGGTTAMLLGVALGVIGMARRKFGV